jgi:RNA 2',3'-cyclic 3'-phosphodiesterase
MAERWFFALWPDLWVRSAIAQAAAGSIPPGARAAHPLDLHVTVAFLGELSPERLALAVSAGDSVGAPSFELRIDSAGYFPRSRVLWCGPREAPCELQALHARLTDALRTRDLPVDARPFRPHITLARKVGRDPTPNWDLPIVWTARELALARGIAGRVPRYVPWRTWKLSADRALWPGSSAGGGLSVDSERPVS